MSRRIALQAELETILGTRNVYFQPPESMRLNYPCIIYNRTSGSTEFADDHPYLKSERYQLTLIDKDPDSLITEKLSSLKSCVFDRIFASDNMNHFVYNIYY